MSYLSNPASPVVGAGITSLNGLTGATQVFANGTVGSTPNVSSSGAIHTINNPVMAAAGVTQGDVTNTAQTLPGLKTFPDGIITSLATLTTPVINGLATGTGVSSATIVNTIVTRDANANIFTNNNVYNYTTIATAAGATTLTVGSSYLQFFTGITTQTVILPVASTLNNGHQFYIRNLSTGNITVQSSGLNIIRILGPNTRIILTCILNSGTTAASWSANYLASVVADGKVMNFNNSLIVNGTDGTTMTFPTANANISAINIAQTVTAVKTYSARLIAQKGVERTFMTQTITANATVDLSAGNPDAKITLQATATVTLTMPAITGGNVIRGELWFIQDATGSRVPTIALTAGTLKWAGGTAPIFTIAINKVDIVSYTWDGTQALLVSTLNF